MTQPLRSRMERQSDNRGSETRISSAEPLRVAIGAVSAAYLATAALGLWVSLRDDLAAGPFGWRTALSILESFLFGLGTALTAPLVLLLALVVANLLLGTARWAADLIAVLGIGFFVGMLAEPITYRILDPGFVTPLATAVVIANLLLPLTLVFLALRIRGLYVVSDVEEADG